jgi:serine/threonine protein kinase
MINLTNNLKIQIGSVTVTPQKGMQLFNLDKSWNFPIPCWEKYKTLDGRAIKVQKKQERIEELKKLNLPLNEKDLGFLLDAVKELKNNLKETNDLSPFLSYDVTIDKCTQVWNLKVYNHHESNKKEFFLGCHFDPDNSDLPHEEKWQLNKQLCIGDGGFKKVWYTWSLTNQPLLLAGCVADLEEDEEIEANKQNVAEQEAFYLRFLRNIEGIVNSFKCNFVEYEGKMMQILMLQYYPICLNVFLNDWESKAVSNKEKLSLALNLAMAVQELHHRKIVHRDIRAENFRLTHEHQPVMIDFGLACSASETQALNHIVGMEFNIPYECLKQRETGKGLYKEGWTEEEAFAIDIWQLGCLLWMIWNENNWPWFDGDPNRQDKQTLSEMESYHNNPPPKDKPLPYFLWRMWHLDPLQRPQIQEIVDFLKGQLQAVDEAIPLKAFFVDSSTIEEFSPPKKIQRQDTGHNSR